MEVAWGTLVSLILVLGLIINEEWVFSPSCKTVSTHDSQLTQEEEDHPDDLKVMMVANLLLLGSDSGYLNRLFIDYSFSKFFRVIILFFSIPNFTNFVFIFL